MSERADDDVRGEQRRAPRQLKQQQQQQQQHIQRGETSSTAMATVAERRSLPSPEIMLGQPWSNWVDAAKLHGNDGAESEESFKELGKNREAMRLCRDDMPIFGQCPAKDDFYLVMCSHCSQVVKPQAFQAHYERRHSSASKPPSTSGPSSAFSLSALSRNRAGGAGGGGPGGGGGALGRSASSSSSSGGTSASSSSSSSNSKLLKPAKEKLPGNQRRPHFPPFRVLHHDKILSPAVKVEKMHLKVDQSVKAAPAPTAPPNPSSSTSSSSSSSSSSTTVSSSASSSSSSPLKPGVAGPSVPKAPQPAPGPHIPNGKGHPSPSLSLSGLDKKQDGGASSRRHLYKRLSEREFNPDIHCGVLDMTARKPCTRSLTCKTHSLSQRRAVPGRRKRFDTLLAEHKSKARERELQRPQQQTPPLRDPHTPNPSPSSAAARLAAHDPHQAAHGNGDTAAKPPPTGKAKPHNPGLPRLNSSVSHGGGAPPGEPPLVAEAPPHSAPPADGVLRPSSDEGENEEREESTDKLDGHYSGYHPRPAAYCTFGSRLFGRSCYAFDRRWDRLRCTFSATIDKHVNSQMWKKIPLALENSSSCSSSSSSSSSSSTPAHRTSTNSSSHGSAPPPSSGFLSPAPAAPPPPPYAQAHDGGKSALSYGTALNARAAPPRPRRAPRRTTRPDKCLRPLRPRCLQPTPPLRRPPPPLPR